MVTLAIPKKKKFNRDVFCEIFNDLHKKHNTNNKENEENEEELLFASAADDGGGGLWSWRSRARPVRKSSPKAAGTELLFFVATSSDGAVPQVVPDTDDDALGHF